MKRFVFTVILFIGICKADLPTGVPDLDDFEAIKERCDKKAGPGAHDKVKTAIEETQKCIKNIINVDAIKTEVEEAKKTGSMDEVFGKYCGKRPEIKECIKKTHDAIQPCLEEEEKNALNITGNILNQISDFACYRDGDRIAMFVAEKGVECLNSRAESIKDCVNQTLKFNPATFSPNSIPNLTIDKKKCDDLTTIQNCIVKDLEDHCSSTTPANVIDALFRFVKKSACKDTKRKRSISAGRLMQRMTILNQSKFKMLMKEKLKARCEQNGGNGTYEKLEASLNGSLDCYLKKRILVTPLKDFQENLRSCSADSRNALKDCLKEEEKYYPDFILELLQSLYGFAYRNMDKIVVNGQPNAEIAACMRDLSKDQVQQDIYRYVNGTSLDYNNESQAVAIPSKTELCRKITEFTNKVSNIIKNTCIRDITITQLVDDFAQSVTSPCESENTEDEQ